MLSKSSRPNHRAFAIQLWSIGYTKGFPEISINTIHGNVWDLDVLFPSKVAKPERGLFVAAEFQEKEATAEPAIVEEEIKEAALGEDQFYEPFADWLKNELEECTKTLA